MAPTTPPPPLQGRAIRLSPSLAPPLAAFLRARLAALGADVGVGPLPPEEGPPESSRFCAREYLPVLVVPSDGNGWVASWLSWSV